MANDTVVRFLSDPYSGFPVPGNYSTTALPTLTYGAGDANLANLLVSFGGEVMAAYSNNLVMQGKVNTKTIASGIHMDFPFTWRLGSEIHGVGEELLGLDTPVSKRRITLDDRPYVSHFNIDNIEEMLSHFQVRAEYAKQAGIELGERQEEAVIKLLVLASRTGPPSTAGSPLIGGGMSDGDGYTFADSGNIVRTTLQALGSDGGDGWNDRRTAILAGTYVEQDALILFEAIDKIILKWDIQNVPQMGRYCVVRPGLWHAVRNLTRVNPGGVAGVQYNERPHYPVPVVGNATVGDTANSSLFYTNAHNYNSMIDYKGVGIFFSNLIPSTNDTTDPYRAGDYTDTIGVVWQSDAVGFLQKMGIMVETDRDVKKGLDFMVAKTMFGGGTLRAQCAVELSSAATE